MNKLNARWHYWSLMLTYYCVYTLTIAGNLRHGYFSRICFTLDASFVTNSHRDGKVVFIRGSNTRLRGLAFFISSAMAAIYIIIVSLSSNPSVWYDLTGYRLTRLSTVPLFRLETDGRSSGDPLDFFLSAMIRFCTLSRIFSTQTRKANV